MPQAIACPNKENVVVLTSVFEDGLMDIIATSLSLETRVRAKVYFS